MRRGKPSKVSSYKASQQEFLVHFQAIFKDLVLIQVPFTKYVQNSSTFRVLLSEI